jgi:hypothetical protein
MPIFGSSPFPSAASQTSSSEISPDSPLGRITQMILSGQVPEEWRPHLARELESIRQDLAKESNAPFSDSVAGTLSVSNSSEPSRYPSWGSLSGSPDWRPPTAFGANPLAATFPDPDSPPLWGRLPVPPDLTSYRPPTVFGGNPSPAPSSGPQTPSRGSLTPPQPTDNGDRPQIALLGRGGPIQMPSENPWGVNARNQADQSRLQNANEPDESIVKVSQAIPRPKPGFGPLPPVFVPGTPENRQWRDQAIRGMQGLVDAWSNAFQGSRGRGRGQDEYWRCLAAAEGTEDDWDNFCDSLGGGMSKTVGAETMKRACRSKTFESKINKRAWCNNQFGNFDE